MTGLFDGHAGALNSLFGAPVTFLPGAGGEVTVHSVFREEPIEVATAEGGSVLTTGPTWRVPRNAGVTPVRGDRLRLADGRTYKILNRITSGSPAADGFVNYELEVLA
jgi:hypothetical protein